MIPKKLFAVITLSPALFSACATADSPGRTDTEELGVNVAALTVATCGNVNDAPAINALIAAATTEVALPPGICNIGSTLTLANGVWIHGAGAATVLKPTTGMTAVFSGTANDARVSDLTIDGNSGSVPAFKVVGNGLSISRVAVRNIVATAVQINASSGSYSNILLTDNVLSMVSSGISINGASNSALSKVMLTNNAINLDLNKGFGFVLRGVRDATVDGNAVMASNGSGVALDSGVSNIIVANNVFRGLASPGTGVVIGGGTLDTNSGIQVNGNNMTGFNRGVSLSSTSNQRFSNVSLTGNIVSAVGESGFVLNDGSDVLVSKNQVRDAQTGVRLQTGNRGGISRLIVSANILRGSSNGGLSSTGVSFGSTNVSDVVLGSNSLVPGSGPFLGVAVSNNPTGAFEAANNLGWKGPTSGLHTGRNTSGSVTKTCEANSSCGSTITVTFRDPSSALVPEPDMNYRVVVTPVAATGTVPAGARRVIAVTKDPGVLAGTSNGFTISLEAALTAPASGPSSVSYDWVVLRDPV